MRPSVSLAAAALAALAGSGCSGNGNPCSGNLVYLTVEAPTFPVDSIVAALSIGGVVQGASVSYPLSPLGDTVTVDVGSRYVVGETVMLQVLALQGSTVVGEGDVTATLAKGCTPATVTLQSNGRGPDGGDDDGGAPDAAAAP